MKHFLKFITFLIITTSAYASSSHKIKLPPVHNLTKTQAEEFLQTFRQQRIIGDYSFYFELTHSSNSKKQKYTGTLLGTWDNNAANFRVQFPSQVDSIIQSGTSPKAWVKQHKSESVDFIPSSTVLNELLPNTLFSPFDIQMPFIWWDQFQYIESKRFKGRATHIFSMSPKENFSYKNSPVHSVKIYLDAQFKALMQADVLDSNNNIIRSTRVLNFKKVDKQWILKTVDIIDPKTKEKSKINIKKANLNIAKISPQKFTLDDLGKPL